MREIDALTMWDLSDLTKYLHQNPPTHELIGDYLGARKRPAEIDATRLGTKDDLKAAADAWRGGHT